MRFDCISGRGTLSNQQQLRKQVHSARLLCKHSHCGGGEGCQQDLVHEKGSSGFEEDCPGDFKA